MRTIEDFDREYEKTPQVPWDRGTFARLYHAIAKKIQNGARVLDLGCGQGQLGEAIAVTRRDVIYRGIDASKIAVAQCQDRLLSLERRFSPQIDHADVLEANLGDHDVAVLCRVLEFVEDDLGLLRRAQKAAKSLIFVVPNHHDTGHLRHFVEAGDAHDRYREIATGMACTEFWHPVQGIRQKWWIAQTPQ